MRTFLSIGPICATSTTSSPTYVSIPLAASRHKQHRSDFVAASALFAGNGVLYKIVYFVCGSCVSNADNDGLDCPKVTSNSLEHT